MVCMRRFSFAPCTAVSSRRRHDTAYNQSTPHETLLPRCTTHLSLTHTTSHRGKSFQVRRPSKASDDPNAVERANAALHRTRNGRTHRPIHSSHCGAQLNASPQTPLWDPGPKATPCSSSRELSSVPPSAPLPLTAPTRCTTHPLPPCSALRHRSSRGEGRRRRRW